MDKANKISVIRGSLTRLAEEERLNKRDDSVCKVSSHSFPTACHGGQPENCEGQQERAGDRAANMPGGSSLPSSKHGSVHNPSKSVSLRLHESNSRISGAVAAAAAQLFHQPPLHFYSNQYVQIEKNNQQNSLWGGKQHRQPRVFLCLLCTPTVASVARAVCLNESLRVKGRPKCTRMNSGSANAVHSSLNQQCSPKNRGCKCCNEKKKRKKNS